LAPAASLKSTLPRLLCAAKSSTLPAQGAAGPQATRSGRVRSPFAAAHGCFAVQVESKRSSGFGGRGGGAMVGGGEPVPVPLPVLVTAGAHDTELWVEVEARLGLPARSAAAPAGIVATTDPGLVIPLTAMS
jgi:hypothetical protein